MEEIECIYNKLAKAVTKKKPVEEPQIEIEIQITQNEEQPKEEQPGDI